MSRQSIVTEQRCHLDTLHRFANQLPTLGNVEELLWYVVEQVIPPLGFEDCVIYLFDDQSDKLVQKAAWDIQSPSHRKNLDEFYLTKGEGIVGAAATSGEVINVPDTTKDDRYKYQELSAVTYYSECSVPLLYNNRVIGVLDSEHSEIAYYTAEKQQLLVTVAALLSTSVGKSMSMEKVEKTIVKLRNAEKLQRALYEIASLLHDSSNMENFYIRLHEIINNLMYASNFGIALYDNERETINIPYLIDTVDVRLDETIPLEQLKNTLTFYCLKQNKTFLLNGNDFVAMGEKHGFTRLGTTPLAWLGVPFILDKNTRGIIIVQSYIQSIVYTEKDAELLEFVAQHLNTTLKYKRAQEQIQHQALHDALTGLPNRTLFTDRLQHRMDSRKRNCEGMFAILFLDLDHFKIINDTLGHHVGDSVLQEVSEHLTNCVRINDTVARFGGDEFAILLESIEAQSEAIDAANRIIDGVVKTMEFEDKSYQLSVSIGIRCCTDESDIVELMKNADMAMYQAKQSGRACYSIYLKDQIIIEQTRKKLKAELKQAIIEDQFELYYQPVILLEDYSIISFEALVRWQHPSRGLLIPDDFLDVAEQTDQVVDIDMLVMDKALAQLKQWGIDNPEMERLSVNVNLSARHFGSTDIVSKIQELLSKHQLSGSRLKIEVTETALIESLEVMTNLINQIKKLDVSILLDDFGTGYSSLSYLHQFPIDILKIDQTFISNMPMNTDDNPIITTIIALANAMSMGTVAEGIEEYYQLEKLAEIGCKYGQGDFFSKPLATDKVKNLFFTGIKRP